MRSPTASAPLQPRRARAARRATLRRAKPPAAPASLAPLRRLPLLLLALLLLTPAPVAGADDDAPEPQRKVLVEYFTAVWCTSCAIGEPAIEQVVEARDDVAILMYHPGFWAGEGDPDPRAFTGWTEDDPYGVRSVAKRYEEYAINGFPTMVVNGDVERKEVGASWTGERKQVYEGMLDEYASDPSASLTLTPLEFDGDNATLAVRYQTTTPATGGWELRLALYEDYDYWFGWDGRGLGSNGIRVHRYIARELLPPVSVAGLASFDLTQTVLLDEDWDRENLGLVAFVQHNATYEVTVAASEGPEPAPAEPEQGLPAPSVMLAAAALVVAGRRRR